jgi:5-formyltetrahydrofolate cyclo-ligase
VTKEELRKYVWSEMRLARVARFPGAKGRIPNFTGAEKCAEMVGQLAPWNKARTIKSNPDSPQRAIRHLALKQGKTIYMAVPRLREEKCFIELDPENLGKNIYKASSIKGAFEYGRPVSIDEMPEIDLILCGSVAVRADGARIGKGGGYSDLEYGLCREVRKVSTKTPIITTVHPIQLIDEEIELKPHDIPLNFIVMPERVIRCDGKLSKPKGIYWEYLDEEQIAAIPVLQALRPLRPSGKTR